MEDKVIYEDEILFVSEEVFGDDKEHEYNCECHDGVAYCDRCNRDDVNAPEFIKVVYPKLAEILTHEELADEVRAYRGLDASCEIHYGDIMMKYGEIV